MDGEVTEVECRMRWQPHDTQACEDKQAPPNTAAKIAQSVTLSSVFTFASISLASMRKLSPRKERGALKNAVRANGAQAKALQVLQTCKVASAAPVPTLPTEAFNERPTLRCITVQLQSAPAVRVRSSCPHRFKQSEPNSFARLTPRHADGVRKSMTCWIAHEKP